MTSGGLGRIYQDHEIIVRQGEVGENMFVVQEGWVEVFLERQGAEVFLRTLGKGEIIGEMGLFDRDIRSATVRARGQARLLTVDRKTFLRRIHEDPSLAFRLVETMSRRIRDLSDEVARLCLEQDKGVPHGPTAP
jgi:CRP/FNR family transcriptional regulator, cyclic AMP receptor protein